MEITSGCSELGLSLLGVTAVEQQARDTENQHIFNNTGSQTAHRRFNRMGFNRIRIQSWAQRPLSFAEGPFVFLDLLPPFQWEDDLIYGADH